MMTKKKRNEVQAEVAALLRQLPGRSPRAWLRKEIESAKGQRHRDVETLEHLCAALQRQAAVSTKPQSRRRPARR